MRHARLKIKELSIHFLSRANAWHVVRIFHIILNSYILDKYHLRGKFVANLQFYALSIIEKNTSLFNFAKNQPNRHCFLIILRNFYKFGPNK